MGVKDIVTCRAYLMLHTVEKETDQRMGGSIFYTKAGTS